MPFRPTFPRRCSHDPKLSSFLSALASFAASPSSSPAAGSVPAVPTPAAYNALMSAYSRAGRPDEVLRLFRFLPFHPTARIFTTLISSLAASGRPMAARAAFSSLIVSGLTPTASAFTALLKSYDSSLDAMYQVFLAMAAARCSPDAAVYNCYISVLCDSQRLEEARGFLDHMVDEGVRPTVRSYTTILRGYCQQGKILEAEKLVDDMVDAGCQPDVVSYSVLIEGLCSVREFDKVERILRESEDKGWTPNAITYNIYMSGLCRTGLLDDTFRQVDIMRSRGLLPTVETVNILFDCLCRDSRFSEAVLLLEHSEELGWHADVFCYNTLMGRLCDIGDFARVFKLLVDLLKKGIGPDMFSFTIAIRGLCGAGKHRVAECLIDNESIGYDVVAFNTLIHGFCIAGDLRGVKLTYMNMYSRQISPNNYTHALLIDSLFNDRKFVEAIDTLASLRDGLVPDHLIHLNNFLAKGIKFTKVLNLLDEIRYRGFVLDTCIFIPLVRVLCCEGYYQRASINEVSLILTSLLGIR
ncbi:putative pentatricopeptide repeat-containing protein At1g12700, mitochondrial [Brachypodium distachyon]|nr:putative pentatricopeptide repeat-containing protein At1g12700, mitochondrial [Brachypodium distachyon]XP_010228965.1 putative pentatricopeptide repeat-containing protein At1g12700, mitochondrial [Brachypodium distachyon]XP_024313179.1 putative pentatricopeptide repeat-containing protein At1g12700, mitochondrial [Brachypodium distachyon]|eukprot:XP_003561883.1 putative pentatricopeptide repeat-containing protein At1g12700, mitochondrial [Brachypodium distachyon]